MRRAVLKPDISTDIVPTSIDGKANKPGGIGKLFLGYSGGVVGHDDHRASNYRAGIVVDGSGERRAGRLRHAQQRGEKRSQPKSKETSGILPLLKSENRV